MRGKQNLPFAITQLKSGDCSVVRNTLANMAHYSYSKKKEADKSLKSAIKYGFAKEVRKTVNRKRDMENRHLFRRYIS